MSQLKKAVEMAKAERYTRMLDEAPTLKIPEEHKEPELAFDFTETRVIETPVEDLLKNRVVAMDKRSPAADYFKLLRTRLFQQTRRKKWNTIQVTGFGCGEGKSLVAANLAISIAEDTRQTTLLADLDFRRPAIGRIFGLGEECPGLKSYFMEDAPLESLFISPGIKKLTLLPAGGKIDHATELLGSSGMEALIKELKQRYDDRYIILDTPGINVCPDPLIIAEYVDAVLLVARMGKTRREGIRSAMDRIPKEKLLGIVLNDADEEGSSRYGYGYGVSE